MCVAYLSHMTHYVVMMMTPVQRHKLKTVDDANLLFCEEIYNDRFQGLNLKTWPGQIEQLHHSSIYSWAWTRAAFEIHLLASIRPHPQYVQFVQLDKWQLSNENVLLNSNPTRFNFGHVFTNVIKF